MLHPTLVIICLHPKLEISLVTYLSAYTWFLTIIAVTENTLDTELNAPSSTGTTLSAPNNAACNTFIFMAASNIFVQFALYLYQDIKCYTKRRKMHHCLFCDKKCINFGIKLDAEILIWMQSGFDGFDFSATLALMITDTPPTSSKTL